MIADPFLPLEPCVSPLAQHVVVGETSATERLGKHLGLLVGRVEPELVGAFRFHARYFTQKLELCKVLFQRFCPRPEGRGLKGPR